MAFQNLNINKENYFVMPVSANKVDSARQISENVICKEKIRIPEKFLGNLLLFCVDHDIFIYHRRMK